MPAGGLGETGGSTSFSQHSAAHVLPQSKMGVSNGVPVIPSSVRTRSPCSPCLQPDLPGRDGLGIPPRLWRLLRLGIFTIPNFQHLFTSRITGHCPRNSAFKRTLGVCTGGRVEGLAAGVIFMKKKLCHKPPCCVIARWALKGKEAFQG